MRIVKENCKNDDLWLKWSLRALKSVFGYEFQGDNVLIARENMLCDYRDYYKEHFQTEPAIDLLKTVANIIAWNIWQMDGLKCVVPYSCQKERPQNYQLSLFDYLDEDNVAEKITPCIGCEKNNLFMHNGIYCRIYDWTNLNKSVLFVDIFRKGNHYGNI